MPIRPRRSLRTRVRALARGAGAALVLVLALAGGARAGIAVGFSPQSPSVTTSTDITLAVQVSEAGTPFNAFDLVVSYDPTALTFVPLVPTSSQQGVYMTGACGTTFHRFSAAGDSLVVNESLLCSGVSLSGPGTIYTLKFHTAATARTTVVHVRRVRFYDAGLVVGPVVATDDTITIAPPAGVEAGVPAPVTALHAWPVPARGALTLAVSAARAGEQSLDVLDLGGRRVRALGRGVFAAGERRVAWDGRDDAGRALPPGVYRVVLATGDARVQTRVTLLR